MALVRVVGGNLIRKIHWNLLSAHTAADLNQLEFSARVHAAAERRHDEKLEILLILNSMQVFYSTSRIWFSISFPINSAVKAAVQASRSV